MLTTCVDLVLSIGARLTLDRRARLESVLFPKTIKATRNFIIIRVKRSSRQSSSLMLLQDYINGKRFGPETLIGATV